MERASTPARIRIGLMALSLAAACAALAAACGAPSGDAKPAVPRGIVLFCVDTLRADSWSLEETSPGAMPRLQGFARDATWFVDASAPSAWTAPSVTSLLTGLLPSEHGVLVYGKTPALIPAVTTLAEMLKTAGWSTAACTGGGWVTPEQGLGQGFDRFTVTFDEAGAASSIATWDTTRPADRPFFLFLHTYAAHSPYGRLGLPKHGPSAVRPAATLAPADLLAGLARGGGRLPTDLWTPFCLQYLTNPEGRIPCSQAVGAVRFDELWRESMGWMDGGYASLGDRAAIEGAIRDAYRAGLPSADEALGDALTALRSRGLLDTTDVVFVGDHGEAFGEHLTLGHGLNLYDEVLRVPLLVRAAERMPARRLVRGSASLLDVVPTILDLARVTAPAGLAGRSLVAVAREEGRGRPVVAEFERAQSPERPAEARLRQVSVRTEVAKWVLTSDPADGRVIREELYDLEADPAESKSLDVSAGPPARFGDEFCQAVAEQRNRVRRLAGLAPIPVRCAADR